MDIESKKFYIYLIIIRTGCMITVPILVKKEFYPWLIIPFLLFIAGEVCIHYGLFDKKKTYRILCQLIHFHFSFPLEDDVRCSLLIPAIVKSVLIQKARFGDEISNSKIPFGKGVAGRCFSSKKSILEIITGDFLEYMMKVGFTKKEARQFKPRKSYLCVPIQKGKDDPEQPLGVISLDSARRDTFNNDILFAIENEIIPHFYELLSERR